MKRDMDLVRKILFALEDKKSGVLPNSLEIKDFTKTAVNHHLALLADTELVAAHMVRGTINHYRLTNQGHDFIEAIRSDTHWNKAKDAAQKAGLFALGLGFNTIIEYLKAQLLKLNGLP